MTELNQHWLERLQVIGKAQARYLWVLLVTMLFYLALTPHVISSSTDAPLNTPIVNLELSGNAVLKFGPLVMSFLVLAILGSLRAYSHARKQLGLNGSADWSGEEFDTSPNAIDLSLYATSRSPKILATIAHFVYPAFLLSALIEAAWLEKHLYCRGENWHVLAGALLWVPALCLVLNLIYKRVTQVPTLWKTK